MAKQTSGGKMVKKTTKKRPNQHSKKKSKIKTSKNYKKQNRGQGK
jgi:hypothetical protein